MQPQNDEAHQYDEDTIRHSFDKIGECKGLKIVHLNIQGLRGSLDELKVALQRMHVYVLTISETKLTDNVDDEQINISGYRLYRKDRISGTVGVACYIYTDKYIWI